MTTTEASDVNGQLDGLLGEPCCGQLVQSYFDESSVFAGATFSTLGENTRDNFTEVDLLAVTLLDVTISPRSVRHILYRDSTELTDLLQPVPADVDLWAAKAEHLSGATDLWNRLRKYTSIDWVTAGKLMARKRPRLIPIVDSVVGGFIPAEPHKYWEAFARALSDPTRLSHVQALRPRELDERVSDLRVLDAAIWMRHSKGRAAVLARQHAGCIDTL